MGLGDLSTSEIAEPQEVKREINFESAALACRRRGIKVTGRGPLGKGHLPPDGNYSSKREGLGGGRAGGRTEDDREPGDAPQHSPAAPLTVLIKLPCPQTCYLSAPPDRQASPTAVSPEFGPSAWQVLNKHLWSQPAWLSG